MKYIVKIFVVTFLLLVCTYNSTFAEQKIVVLDMTYVLNQSKAGKGAQDFLKKSLSNNQKKFKEIEDNLKKEEGDLLGKRTVLSKEEYQKKADVLRKKVIDYQSQRRVALDKIATQRTESRKILIDKLDPILSDYIKENDISLVIDKKHMLGGKPEHDITKIIIEKLNKEDVKGYEELVTFTKKIFDKGFTQLADVPFDKPFVMMQQLPALLKLKSYKSVYSLVSSYIQNEKLRRMLSMHPLVVGGNPFTTTSIYGLILYLEKK